MGRRKVHKQITVPRKDAEYIHQYYRKVLKKGKAGTYKKRKKRDPLPMGELFTKEDEEPWL